ncbi:type VI secretion system protein ImpF [Rhodobacter aestuarii]|uniref:Type VI secretion system protein ImpF n=1 Tax=Rhodobacter aestuarii TaxID=453582 RepID=A0A1N7JVR7_9RHOB|nr:MULTISPECIES: GPW/gp25 family protein [Rhodobacter]PTV95971.1 type VI secretion system protein ImpF [Rhodobacter aestuarii]SIS53381.1 type VI secretion system protein ImpF [Rhodobacter aestuarii]SOC10503.1 type VI secretion system protein ImpF [Rhodobacter sp. JA431]
MRQPVSSASGSGRTPQSGFKQRDRARRQLSVMHVFRLCAETGSSRKSTMQALSSDGETTTPPMVRLAREGVSPEDLRRHLSIDLASLMNTIRLDSVINLDNQPNVRRSVINHGFLDLTAIARSRRAELAIAEEIRRTLIEREPRLNPDTLSVTLGEQDQTRTEKLTYQIEAEIRAYPADVPVGFTAEIDVGAGKIRMRGMQGGR